MRNKLKNNERKAKRWIMKKRMEYKGEAKRGRKK
jgi:hypothetical protein